jgi:hypothetical protein
VRLTIFACGSPLAGGVLLGFAQRDITQITLREGSAPSAPPPRVIHTRTYAAPLAEHFSGRFFAFQRLLSGPILITARATGHAVARKQVVLRPALCKHRLPRRNRVSRHAAGRHPRTVLL